MCIVVPDITIENFSVIKEFLNALSMYGIKVWAIDPETNSDVIMSSVTSDSSNLPFLIRPFVEHGSEKGFSYVHFVLQVQALRL
jgi:hypothetical protein